MADSSRVSPLNSPRAVGNNRLFFSKVIRIVTDISIEV